MTVKEYLKKTYNPVENMPYILLKRRPRIICNDGFSVSVQASEYHYCEPEKNLISGNYKSVELGYPSEEDDLITQYVDDNYYTSTIYPYVPLEVVEKLIEKHGGIKEF